MQTDHFEQIVSEHYESLYRFAFSLTRVEADALDLTQQAFYLWATKGHQLRDRSKVKTWLFTTLHRAFLDARRKQQRFFPSSLDELVSQEPPVLTIESTDNADHVPVLQALAQVDKSYQAAVALFYLGDNSYLEIAGILHVPIGTVKSRLARGLAQLRQILQCEGTEECVQYVF